MRVRPLLSAAAIIGAAALILTGCSSAETPDPSASPDASASADLCGQLAPEGDVVKQLKVTGEFGKLPTVDALSAPATISEVESLTLIQGSGEKIKSGDLVQYKLSVYDADKGELQGEAGFDSPEPMPAALTAESLLAQGIGCAAIGSRVVFATPAMTQSQAQQPAAFYVVDVVGVTPAKAWGADVAPVDGMPTVTLAGNGEPKIEIPSGDAPTEVKLETLKKGDGPVVEPGATVLVQYSGIKWSDGTVFDSTWGRGAVPTSFSTSGVVEGFRMALEGQTVGSQVLVVIPPAFGYGASAGHELQNETLVFVVDILYASGAPVAQ